MRSRMRTKHGPNSLINCNDCTYSAWDVYFISLFYLFFKVWYLFAQSIWFMSLKVNPGKIIIPWCPGVNIYLIIKNTWSKFETLHSFQVSDVYQWSVPQCNYMCWSTVSKNDFEVLYKIHDSRLLLFSTTENTKLVHIRHENIKTECNMKE